MVGTTLVEGYGNVSNARIKEVERRRILKYEKVDEHGRPGYYVGRMGDDGKIAEREPRY